MMPLSSEARFLTPEVAKEDASVRNRKLCSEFILAGCFDVAGGDVFNETIKGGHCQPITRHFPRQGKQEQ